MFGVSSLGTVSLDELRKAHDTSQIYQFYFHKDRGLNRAMLQRAKDARHRHYDADRRQHYGWEPRNAIFRTGFSIPFRLTLAGNAAICNEAEVGKSNYITHERFRLPQLEEHIDMRGQRAFDRRLFHGRCSTHR